MNEPLIEIEQLKTDLEKWNAMRKMLANAISVLDSLGSLNRVAELETELARLRELLTEGTNIAVRTGWVSFQDWRVRARAALESTTPPQKD